MGYASAVRSSEWIGVVYFAYLAIASWLGTRATIRRLQVAVTSLAMCAAIAIIARRASTSVRDWAPFASIGAGYYVSGWLFATPSIRFEAWLLEWDRRLLGDPTRRFALWPGWLLAYLDIVYTGCFLLLPAGFAALWARGHQSLADRYWSMVAIAELGSFGALAFVQSRPPWALERPPALPDSTIHTAAAHIVREFTTGANTFPSGHVAGSFAIALALLPVEPMAGGLFLVFAASIALACVIGRYHYVVDLLAGALLAVVAAALVWAIGI